jgi:HD-GYP domain-containing protein (c-di-GMP phosphodiesterase class II)
MAPAEAMKAQQEIWYVRGSPVARLALPLGERWSLRELPRPKSSKTRSRLPSLSNNTQVVCLVDLRRDDCAGMQRQIGRREQVRLVGFGSAADWPDVSRRGRELFAVLPRKISANSIERTIAMAFENIDLSLRERATREDLERAEREMEQLNRIGVALSAERDITRLLGLILREAREITSADAGSLYLVEQTGDHEQRLRFKLTQNDSRQFPFTEYTLAITESSMAGHVALNGDVIQIDDVYQIPADRPYRFNPKYDQDSGYRARSMLTLPMKNTKGDVIGVLQLINCKKQKDAKLLSAADTARLVTPFSARAARLALSLASQAAVAYETSKLYQDIETLFEGFVRAAVTAIEQRDPTTSGHSARVSTLTVGLAEVVDRSDAGTYSGTRFSREQMKEIRYAALLHDFGKVGVREDVLVKAKKLYPWQLSLLRGRFDYIHKELEARTSKQKLDYLLEKTRDEALSLIGPIDDEHQRRVAEIDDYFQTILEANEPTVLAGGKFDRLIEIARQTYADSRGTVRNYLDPEEVRFLSIPKGSLDPAERVQIESHVIYTFNFLTQIPWTKEIGDIPAIARAHHEKLNGSGYPYQLKAEDIAVQTRMMTICDIFDALSASDRPYKKAVPADRAIAILDDSAQHQEIDQELFKLFLDAKIYELTTRR